jgi:hypothetical protein
MQDAGRGDLMIGPLSRAARLLNWSNSHFSATRILNPDLRHYAPLLNRR